MILQFASKARPCEQWAVMAGQSGIEAFRVPHPFCLFRRPQALHDLTKRIVKSPGAEDLTRLSRKFVVHEFGCSARLPTRSDRPGRPLPRRGRPGPDRSRPLLSRRRELPGGRDLRRRRPVCLRGPAVGMRSELPESVLFPHFAISSTGGLREADPKGRTVEAGRSQLLPKRPNSKACALQTKISSSFSG